MKNETAQPIIEVRNLKEYFNINMGLLRTKSRNVLVAALILVLSIGISYSSAGSLQLGAISLSGLAVGSIVGIVLNAIMPGKDYVYGEDKQGDKSVNFIVQ